MDILRVVVSAAAAPDPARSSCDAPAPAASVMPPALLSMFQTDLGTPAVFAYSRQSLPKSIWLGQGEPSLRRATGISGSLGPSSFRQRSTSSHLSRSCATYW